MFFNCELLILGLPNMFSVNIYLLIYQTARFSYIFFFASFASDNINYITSFRNEGVFQQKSFINLFKLIKGCF